MKKSFRSLTVLAAVAACLVAQAADYTVQDLGPLPNPFTQDAASGINAAGEVVGYVTGSSSQAFRWVPGTGYEVLPTLGRAPAYGYGINDGGTVVGQSGVLGGTGSDTRPFRQLPGGAVEDLGTLGGAFGEARGINSAGVIVGGSYTGSTTRAFIWQEGSGMSELGGLTPTGLSIAYGIDDLGRVAGAGQNAGGETHGFYFDGVNFHDVGTLGSGTLSRALALNEAGTVVGFGGLNALDTTYGAFAWTLGGGLTPLGGLFEYDTRATALNDGGDIVGSSWIDTMGSSRAVIWKGGGAVANLNDLIDPGSGWLLTGATGINGLGQIVGFGQLGGANRAFLLTPVPEPATMAALGLGVLGLLRRRKRA